MVSRRHWDHGDHTTFSTIPESASGSAKLWVKQEGILAGAEVARKIFHRFDPQVLFELSISDGSSIVPGEVAFRV